MACRPVEGAAVEGAERGVAPAATVEREKGSARTGRREGERERRKGTN